MSRLMRILGALLLAGLAAAIWFAGPLIPLGPGRPLEPVWIRATLVGMLSGLALLLLAWGLWRAGHAEHTLAAAGSGSEDGKILEARIRDAIATLKRSSGKRHFLYELPWYVVIGPPDAGKTTALANSGLKFPLAAPGSSLPLTGGGTRYCDWWFGEDAVLVDTAGRYLTQDSDRKADGQGWLSFLSLLKAHRPRQPINGVVLALSLADLLAASPQERDALAACIRDRLAELHDVLKIEFPVYVLFTKADLVSGFTACFGRLDEAERRKVWGATFQTSMRGASTLEEVPGHFDALVRRLSEATADRLQEEADPAARLAIFGFPARFALLRDGIADLLARIFAAKGQRAAASLRGFYFSSGTQEGMPIDPLPGALGLGQRPAGDRLPRKGQGFFLHDLLAQVIFAESGWATHDAAVRGRAGTMRHAGFGLIACAVAAALGGMGLAYYSNHALIAAATTALAQYRTGAATLDKEASVGDVNLEKVITGLDALRDLPAGYATRQAPTPPEETFGFSQRAQLLSASSAAYRQALERHLRSRLLLAMEQTIRTRMADPVALYEPLKIYLMLGGKAPRSDDGLIVAWLKRDWEQNRYPGASNREGRADLEDHLRAMLVLDDGQAPVYELDTSLVEAAQRSLGRLTVADRAATLLKAAMSAAAPEDFVVVERGGPEARLVFDTTDGSELSKLAIQGAYTYDGFHRFYLPELSRVAERLVAERWVVGAGGEQGAVESELLRVGPDLLDRYNRDFVAAWNAVLDRLKFRPMSSGKPEYLALSAAASAQSPILQLFGAIATETSLTRGPAVLLAPGAAAPDVPDEAELAKGLARIGIDFASSKSQSRAGAAFANASGQNPGAAIETAFRPYQLLVTGAPGQRPIDAVVQNFRDIYKGLLLAASVPAQSERVNANLQLQVSTLRSNATRLPKALATMVRLAADDFEDNATETSIGQLNRLLAETVTSACQKTLSGRFPFAASSTDDVPMTDFAVLFAPNGIIDRFFAQYLAPLVDMSSQDWAWKQDSKVARGLSKPTLKDFQFAADIRDAFFPAGSSVPAVEMTFTPLSLDAATQSALLEVNGQTVQSRQSGNVPVTLRWPGSLTSQTSGLALLPELPGRTSRLKFEGDWGVKRLMDGASLASKGDALEAHFVVGGREAAYSVQFKPPGNPFAIPAFSGFGCPTSF